MPLVTVVWAFKILTCINSVLYTLLHAADSSMKHKVIMNFTQNGSKLQVKVWSREEEVYFMNVKCRMSPHSV